ncbi:bifunctional metallophosphatase/5'-nucleotidase [Bacillus sp. BGMRC 2118]|nr:bifunctional metallophosphatase/5'-nucleotidase [Bacillus sp. BGMRC 2118]
MKLKIIHTNDLHSNFENFERTTTLIKELKDENTLLLDGGDFADFKSIELQGTRGLAAIELLESVGYDALTIGNNEMFNGVDTLEYMAKTSRVPFISSNLLKKDMSTIEGVVSSTIIEKNGIKIFITGASPDMGEFSEGLGLFMKSYKEMILQEIERNKGKYDIGIILNHVGTEADEVLAGELSGVHVILSAHDHKLFEKAKVVNSTILNSAGCYGEYVGVVEIEIKDDNVELLDSKTIATKDFQSDAEILSILKVNKEKAIEVLSKPLYPISKPLWHDVLEENPITNLIADGLKDLLDCEIGLINSGIVNAGIFDFVSNKKLIEVCPSPLNPTSLEMQGKAIREAIEASLDVQVCLADGRGPGFRGKFVGKLHVSGATILHNGKNVLEVIIGEKPLEDDRWYKVATSDYLQRGSGYESLAENQNPVYLAEEIRDVIREYARNPRVLEEAYNNRWKKKLGIAIQ